MRKDWGRVRDRLENLRQVGRPRTWLSEICFVEKYHLAIPVPPRCLCGKQDYRFNKVGIDVQARCNVCLSVLTYDDRFEHWVFIH